MQSSFTKNLALLAFLVVLILFQIHPLSGAGHVWRPEFVLLLAIYITHRRLSGYVVEIACLCGLLLDVVYGGLLGKHAIAFGLSIYLLRGFRVRLQHTRLFHEIILVFLLTVLSQVLLYSVNALVQDAVSGAWIIFPAFTTALTWPLLSRVLDRVIVPPEI